MSAHYFEPPAANGTLVSRYITNAAVNVTNNVAGTYVDFGGTFTTTITTLAGDQVVCRVSTLYGKAIAGTVAVVFDRSGTKLPTTGGAVHTQSQFNTFGGTIGAPFMLEHWDTPGAGTFTYKPQVYTPDNNVATVGFGATCQFVVEIWR